MALLAGQLPKTLIERLALVVEDEWIVRLELVLTLESQGWTVIDTNSGEEALSLLARGERFSLVVSDIRLDGTITGWDVAEACRASQPDIAVVYTSASPALEDRLVPGSQFLAKPVPMQRLVAVCEDLARRANPQP